MHSLTREQHHVRTLAASLHEVVNSYIAGIEDVGLPRLLSQVSEYEIKSVAFFRYGRSRPNAYSDESIS